MTLLPMENRESILCALKCFGKEKPNNIPPILEDYIKQIARNGQTIIPFTIQRICELFENPFRHYNRPDKFLRGLEKTLSTMVRFRRLKYVSLGIKLVLDKLHREDPRFPSQAGMDEYDVVGDPVLSLPSSPSVDDLHRQQTSKSSDDEVTDEDEDEEDENQTENSSHGSSTSPQESTSLGQPPMLSGTSAPGVWPFETNHMGDSALSKQQFRNLVLTSTQRVDPSSALISPPSSNTSSERPDGSTKESISVNFSKKTLPDVTCSSFSPEAESVCDELNRKQSSFHGKKRSDTGPLFTAHEMEASAVISKSPSTHLNATECNNSSSPSKSPAGTSIEETAKILNIGETVPSIVQVLRPIGQLEAFVQNMGGDMSCPTSLPGLLDDGPNSSECRSDAPCASPHHGDHLKICSTSPPVCSKAKRRASPVHDLDSPNQHLSDSTGYNSNEISQPHQSPAKRRRLTETTPSTPESDSQLPSHSVRTTYASTPHMGYAARCRLDRPLCNFVDVVPKISFLPTSRPLFPNSSLHFSPFTKQHTLVGTPPTALNDSPPIIVCNPLSQNRDLESCERTSCVVPLIDEHILQNTQAVHTSDVETDGATTVNSPAVLSSGTLLPHINMATEDEEV
ncbi:uncharacterized protein DEA37_0002631 [Paragonimus westermani]|uniref:Serine/threonine-protein phosphatase 4 regulatory subunit 2 n=1 Tax=Paragonimus westermani TaxID=34504 RepID=A0A5J4NM89_9TREM|nr:uncharacterized protein DEA37_0002631 [Paragonimus westermani]